MCHTRPSALLFVSFFVAACSGTDPGNPDERSGDRDPSATAGSDPKDGEGAGTDPNAEGSDEAKTSDEEAEEEDLEATLPGIGDGELGPSGENREITVGTGGAGAATGTAFAAPGAPSLAGGGGMSSAGPVPVSVATVDSDSAAEGAGALDPAVTSGAPRELSVPIVDVAPEAEPTAPFEAGMLTAGAWDDNINFQRFLNYRLGVEQFAGLPPWTLDGHEAANAAWADAQHERQVLDVALVIDTTGSMGDELAYLQQEFLALAQTISDTYANAEQRWSLVVYKDAGDEYVVRWYDFSKDVSEFREQLAVQSYGGGGDFPESPDQALSTVAQLAWRTSDQAARLLFWVADAPHHDHRAKEMAASIAALQALDIHVYPVASSGIDEFTEFTMRASAQLTLGRYLFLTDDSGYGSSHKEPTIPCYYVTALDEAILRMVDLEMTGERALPDEDSIVRTVGDPVDGICQLESGAARAL